MGDIFHVPDVFTNAFTAQTQSSQGAEVTTVGPAQVDTTLTINTHKYVAYLIGDKDMKQLMKSYDYNGVYARKAGKTLGNALEAALAALWSSLSTNSVGTTSAVVTDLNVRSAINKLAAANFRTEDMGFFFHPTAFWTQLVAIQKYYDQSQRGIDTGAGSSRTGSISGQPTVTATQNQRGVVYGIPVYVSSNVVSGLQVYRNLLLDKSCFGFALQTQGEFGGARIQTDYLVQNLGTLTVADILYGATVLREPAGCQINTNNTATTA